jgi:putative lipoprotein (rSAM/lipoprotein system)
VKKVKHLFWKKQNAIIAAFLTILGFSCTCKRDPVIKYGTPEAKFIVKGKVESAQNNTPVENIRIILNGDSVSTDSNGNYQFPGITRFPESQTFEIGFKDRDGSINGSFKNLDTVVIFNNPVFTNGDGEWYEGETEKQFDVKLKPE